MAVPGLLAVVQVSAGVVAPEVLEEWIECLLLLPPPRDGVEDGCGAHHLVAVQAASRDVTSRTSLP